MHMHAKDSVAKGRPAAIQPEAGGTPGSLNYTTMGWGYWRYPFIPPVDLMKWLEPRWLSQVCLTLTNIWHCSQFFVAKCMLSCIDGK
jgi:hypothetical protein